MKDHAEADKSNGLQNADSRKGRDAPELPSRRKVLIGGATAGAALILGASPRIFAAAPGVTKEIRIGYISPRSGPLGLFGESDPYTLSIIRKAVAKGLTIHGETYRVTILDRDSESSPSHASQLASDLITKEHIHLMLASSTPEVVNPVSDVCEGAGVPSIGTDCPLESFFFGRGGRLGEASPFKWTFDMSFGAAQNADCFIGQWPHVKTNKKIAVMYPNDADGNGFRAYLTPIFEKNGYTVIDPGAYADGATDYSSQIALFKREKCEIFNGVGLPPDIDTFWRQAAQLHFLQNLRIAEMTKAGFFTSQIVPLGPLGIGISAPTAWSPAFPYKSRLTGQTSQEMGDGYEKATGRIWSCQQGQCVSLFEVAVHVLKNAKDPLSNAAIRNVIPKVDLITTVGRVNFKKGPYPNTATTNLLGTQYFKAPEGSRFKLERLVVDNTQDPNVPIQHKPVPYRI
ncbi:MAG: ABC transporter substrate-binding protein [Rhodanobacteraceae bacterium]